MAMECSAKNDEKHDKKKEIIKRRKMLIHLMPKVIQ